MQSLMPEFFMLLGIDIFLATSVLTCVLDKYLPDKLAYLYQLLALAGFGQLLVTHQFLPSFGDYMRFWYSTIYLLVATANVVSLNAYLYFIKRARVVSHLFSLMATAPVIILSTLFLNNYVSEATHVIIPLPSVPLDLMFLGIFAFDISVVSVSVYALVRPKWWQITAPAAALLGGAVTFLSLKPALGEATFIAGSIYIYIILGIACVGVLGASLYVLLRFWLQTQKRRREVRR